MEFYKLLNLSFGVKADFEILYKEISASHESKASSDEWLKEILGMSEKHVLFLKKEETQEMAFIYFNPPYANINFTLQRIALTFNKQMVTPEDTSPENFKKQVEDYSRKMSIVMKEKNVGFLSHPFLHVELIYYSDKIDYSKLLRNLVWGSANLNNTSLEKCTFGFTTSRESTPGKQEYLETIVEHWLKNKDFLFVSGTAQWNIMEHRDTDLNFFSRWASDILNNFEAILKRLEGCKIC